MSKIYEKADEYTKKYWHLLNKCNNCGCETNVILPDRRIFRQKGEGLYVWSVSCGNDCGQCVFGYRTVKEAIAAWNRITKEQIKEM